MKQVKRETQQGQRILSGYRYYKSIKDRGLYTLYKKPSTKKLETYDECIKRAKETGEIIDVKGCGNCDYYSLYIGVILPDGTKAIIQETYLNTFILKDVDI